MRDLFREFERHLGEVVSAQRMASTEARAEGATVIKDIHELRTSAGILAREQRDLVARIEKEWQLRIDQTAQRSGEAQAKAFGENITRGLQAQITALGAKVEHATQATQVLAWKDIHSLGFGHCAGNSAHRRRLCERISAAGG